MPGQIRAFTTASMTAIRSVGLSSSDAWRSFGFCARGAADWLGNRCIERSRGGAHPLASTTRGETDSTDAADLTDTATAAALMGISADRFVRRESNTCC